MLYETLVQADLTILVGFAASWAQATASYVVERMNKTTSKLDDYIIERTHEMISEHDKLIDDTCEAVKAWLHDPTIKLQHRRRNAAPGGFWSEAGENAGPNIKDYYFRLPPAPKKRWRPYKTWEMRALVGKVLAVKATGYWLMVIRFDPSTELIGLGDGYWLDARQLMEYFTIDGHPCGVEEWCDAD